MKKLIPIVFLFILVSGCADVPKKGVGVSDVALIEIPSLEIEGAQYIPFGAIAKSYNAQSAWDPVTRSLSISRQGKEVVFCVGSDTALVDGSVVKMPEAIRMQSGEVMIPAAFAASELKKLFAPFAATAKRIKYAPAQGKYAIRRIVLDPGHGGKDPGAMSAKKIREKDIVLSVAKKTKQYLQDYGIEVILTRDRDRFITLGERPKIANRIEADFFVSIHANACRAKYASGIEVFYLSDAVDDFARKTADAENAALEYETSSFGIHGPKSALAATLWDMLCTENRAESVELAECISKGVSEDLDAKNRGAKPAKFYVLKGAQMPDVLVEIGFLSNQEEAMKLKDPVYQEKLARSIADGILLYKDKYERTEGFTK
ncbi:MAG: N-acetylmuramoyl-L-alanine amidase [Candidatus Omnitrophota bacterium]